MSFTKQDALDYHRKGRPGKIEVVATKPLATQRDLSLAYSPGVAEACLEIDRDPLQAFELTARGNLVAVVSNGSAVLGLGNLGPLGGKPVMEGKGVLFKAICGMWMSLILKSMAQPPRTSSPPARPLRQHLVVSIWKTSKHPNASRSRPGLKKS